jgi:UDP-hydrolysing UDP-N-acetyl-D-glucosamine 2-epimerase
VSDIGRIGDGPAPIASLAVLTTGRQDWGILRTVCEALRAGTAIRLDVLAGGMHVSPRYGLTIEGVRADGFEPVPLDWLGPSSDPPADRQAADALSAVGAHLRATDPDALLLVGDRFETAAAALAATVCRVPIVHLHGGEQSLGAFDDALRHAITKLSHLHLVSHEEHARRVLALGEDPGSVHVVGAPGTDAAFRADLLDRDALAAVLGLELRPPVVLTTVHPTTLDADPSAVAGAVARAMQAMPATWIVTLPNADPGGERARALLAGAVDDAPPGTALAVEALGELRYWSLLRVADAMLGNSSSGLVEAPAVGLPVVNVGDRQAGRLRGPNVIDVPAEPAAIVDGLRRALEPGFRGAAEASIPPLADGRAGQRAADIIAAWQPSRPPRKPPVRIVS